MNALLILSVNRDRVAFPSTEFLLVIVKRGGKRGEGKGGKSTKATWILMILYCELNGQLMICFGEKEFVKVSRNVATSVENRNK